MSVAGGVAKAVERAVVHGCEALQIFSKNANQWNGKPLEPAEIHAFRARIDETGIGPVVAHASYLINLATTFPLLREQSLAAFIDELDRAESLGLLGVVIHPGTCTAGSEEDALRLIAEAIRAAFKARTERTDDGACSNTRPVRAVQSGIDSSTSPQSWSISTDRRESVSVSTPVISSASGYDIVSDGGVCADLR
jgi:endonuclease IV